MAPPTDPEEALRLQAEEVRALKSSIGATKAEVDSAIAKLLELKSAIEPLQQAAKAAKGDADEAAKKAANLAKAEADKAAAREKKKAAKAAKPAGEGAAPAGGAPAAKPAPKDGADSGGPAARDGAAAAPDAKGAPAAGPAAAGQSNREFVVKHHASSPPVLAFLAAKLSGLSVHFLGQSAPGVLCLLPTSHGGGSVAGDVAIARLLADLAHPSRGVAGPPPPALPPAPAGGAPPPPPAERAAYAREQARLRGWLEGSQADALRAGGGAALAELDAALAMRTYLVGASPSLADGAAFAALGANAAWAALNPAAAAASLPHVARWHSHLASLPPFAALELAYLGGKVKGGSFEIDLPGAQRGKVVLRFAPEPSGFLHIGHAKAALLSAHFAAEHEGQLILRFDDTNPSKEKEEYEASIVADVHRLGLRPSRITHTSDYFDLLIAAQRAMIERGEAYVDPSPADEQQKGRFARLPSAYREAPVGESLRLFGEMLAGSEEGARCCVRAKMDFASDNGTLRDPTTFRTNATPHHATGSTFRAYPTYDFACPWVDAHEGVTHALRDRQYKDRDAQYHRMAELQRVRRVELWSFSRMNFKMCLLSKRKLQWFVEQGRVSGWDDPRMPTIQGILRRGLSVAGLRHFILLQGASLNGNLMEWDKLWAENRKLIDASARRFTALPADNLARIVLLPADGADAPPAAPEARSLPAHKKAPELGSKLKWFGPAILLDQSDAAGLAEGEEVTLMDWGNAVVASLQRGPDGAVLGGSARLHLAGDVKSTKKKLTWLCDGLTGGLANVAAELIDLDHLINKDSLDEDEALAVDAPFLNACTREAHAVLAEPAFRGLARGETIQVERRGFYIVDEPFLRPSEPIRLLFVPDGKNMFGHCKPQPQPQ